MSTIFYFTSTGNCLKIAKDISRDINIPSCNVTSIAKSLPIASLLKPTGIVGFVFPVYYAGMPLIVKDFLEQIDLTNANYTFVVAAYAKTTGNAGCLHQTKAILSQKNVKLNSGFYIKTVDNFILWTWDVPSMEKQQKMHIKAGSRSKRISNSITDKAAHFDHSPTEYIAPLLYGYGHFIKNARASGKYFHIGVKCNGCGTCVKVCPTNNIKLDNGKPKWYGNQCERCLACLHLCPNKAINYRNATKNKGRYKNPFIKLEELYNETCD